MIKVVWPERISLNYWAACLVSDYGNSNLPILYDEDNWQEWGAIVAGTPPFLKGGVPSPLFTKEGARREVFKEWDKWAKVVYTIMSDEYK